MKRITSILMAAIFSAILVVTSVSAAAAPLPNYGHDDRYDRRHDRRDDRRDRRDDRRDRRDDRRDRHDDRRDRRHYGWERGRGHDNHNHRGHDHRFCRIRHHH